MQIPLRPMLRQLIEPNPVFKRELRARWRRPAAYLTLFFYAAPLAIGMVLFYASKAPTLVNPSAISLQSGLYYGNGVPVSASALLSNSLSAQMSQIGHDLFVALTLLQIISWLLIAPAIAAPAIAMERERGLLEALQLANLPARRVVLGKWLAILSFMALLFLVPLPITAICFFFGGVTLLDFAKVTLIIALTAVFGAVLGLYFSSRCLRPAQALRDAFLLLLFWSGLTYMAHEQSVSIRNLPLFWQKAACLVELSHPAALILHEDDFVDWPLQKLGNRPNPRVALPAFITGNSASLIVSPAPPVSFAPRSYPLDSKQQWLINVAMLSAFSLLFFALAVRGTGRVLAAPTFARRDWLSRFTSKLAAPQNQQKSGQKWRRALLLEIPFLSRHSFDNPVFGRELRGKTRLRGGAWWLWLLRVVLCAVPLLYYLLLMAEISGNLNRQENGQKLILLGLFCLSLYACVVGSGAFTRERESGTWEGLRLTPLRPAEILQGKLWPLLMACAVFSLPLWPGIWLGIEIPSHKLKSLFTLWHFCTVLSVLLSTVFAIGCVAIFVSWLCRRTPLATGLSLLWAVFLVFLMPVPLQYIDLTKASPGSTLTPLDVLQTTVEPPQRYFMDYPIYANAPVQQAYMSNAFEGLARHYRDVFISGLLCSATMLTLGGILMLILLALMCQKFRDETA